jgi:hypothetical protein
LKTWIVDLDGTLALRGDRGPFDWHRVGEDAPNEPVVAMVDALHHDGHTVLYVTDRMEQCREATVEWLREHVDAPMVPWNLHMRPDDDYRPDEVVKREIYETKIRGHYDVAGVIDDRAKVVKMWREDLGLLCAQVAPGNF